VPANPTPHRARGQAGILPSPGRVSSTGTVERAGAGPTVVGGRVPATVVGTVLGGIVLTAVVDTRRGTVLATVGRVVAGAPVVGAVGASVGAGVASVVGVLTTWATARAQSAPPASDTIAHRHTTAAGRDTRRCLLAGLPLTAFG